MPLSDVKTAVQKEKDQIGAFRDSVRELKEAAPEEGLEAAVFEAWENFFSHRMELLDHILTETDGQRLKRDLREEIRALHSCRALLDAAIENLDPGDLGAEPYLRLTRRELREIRNSLKQLRLRL